MRDTEDRRSAPISAHHPRNECSPSPEYAPGHLSVYGLFRIEIDQILKGKVFLADTQNVLIMESTGASSVNGYPQSPNEYTFALNKEYLFMISAPCTSGHRKLDFPPCPRDTADSILVAFAASRLPWSAFQDTFAVALESSGLNAVSTTADLCATVVVSGINTKPSIAALYTAAFAIRTIHYQPMESTIAPGDTLEVIGEQPGDAPGPAFVAGDTLLVFCQQTASEEWKLVPNVGSALLETEGQFAARVKASRCGSCSSCPPHPVVYYNQGAVSNAISIH